MKALKIFNFFFLFALFACSKNENPIIEVTYNNKLSNESFDGRLLVMISKDGLKEPRFQINDTKDTGILVGKNVENWKSGNVEGFYSKTLAYPIENLGELDNGEYVIQALLHKYETFNLSNGKIVKLPMDQGEGQHWNTSPKNIYSKPIKVNFKKNSTNCD